MNKKEAQALVADIVSCMHNNDLSAYLKYQAEVTMLDRELCDIFLDLLYALASAKHHNMNDWFVNAVETALTHLDYFYYE